MSKTQTLQRESSLKKKRPFSGCMTCVAECRLEDDDDMKMMMIMMMMMMMMMICDALLQFVWMALFAFATTCPKILEREPPPARNSMAWVRQKGRKSELPAVLQRLAGIAPIFSCLQASTRGSPTHLHQNTKPDA